MRAKKAAPDGEEVRDDVGAVSITPQILERGKKHGPILTFDQRAWADSLAMDQSAARTLRVLRNLADKQEACTEAKDCPQTGNSTERCLEIVEASLSDDERLAVYEKVADDQTAVRELRMLVANVLRILARLRTEQTTGGREDGETPKTERAYSVSGDDAEALLFSPMRMAGNLRERANEACRKLLERGHGENFLARK
jgi:hypothetical protein